MKTRWGYDTGINDLFEQQDRSTDLGETRVHFGDVTARCEAFIRASDEIIGAVAWMRSPRLLEALAARPTSIIVNKEFPLRNKGTKERTAAAKLRRPVRAFGKPVRVLGDCSRGSFTSLMHHKFLVRLTRGIPSAVWNGSFNLTSGAGGNLENAVEHHDPAVAIAFYDEFRLLWEASEPLDFKVGAPAGIDGKPVSLTSVRKKRATKRPAPNRTARKKAA